MVFTIRYRFATSKVWRDLKKCSRRMQWHSEDDANAYCERLRSLYPDFVFRVYIWL